MFMQLNPRTAFAIEPAIRSAVIYTPVGAIIRRVEHRVTYLSTIFFLNINKCPLIKLIDRPIVQ